MKITKRQLSRLINEEIKRSLIEAEAHTEKVKVEPWMTKGHGAMQLAQGGVAILFHNGSKKDGSDATLAFGKMPSSYNPLLIDLQGRVIGFWAGKAGPGNWTAHFHAPKNGWRDHNISLVKSGVTVKPSPYQKIDF